VKYSARNFLIPDCEIYFFCGGAHYTAGYLRAQFAWRGSGYGAIVCWAPSDLGCRDNLTLTRETSCRNVMRTNGNFGKSRFLHQLTAETKAPMSLVDTVRLVLKQKGQNVWHISPEACVYEAIEMMAEKYVGALLVVSEGNLVGIVSERDYARKVILQGRSSKETPVKEIMTSPAVFVTPDQRVEDCLRIMTDKRIRHLPIVEDGKILGVVSIGDLVKWMVSDQQQTISQLHSYITSQYPG
jgi:CBS domain-containing protein